MASNSGKAQTYPVWQRAYFHVVPFQYRYSKIFRKTYNFLIRSQNWSRGELLEYQFLQLRELLEHAYLHVPYYTRVFNERGIRPRDIHHQSDMQKLPILTKQMIIDNRDELLSQNYSGETLSFRTSGSTGERLEFLGDDSIYKKEAAFVLRSFKAHDADLYGKPSIWLRRYVPKNKNEPLWYYDAELKRLYMSAYHLTKDTVSAYVEAINKTKSDILVGYPSSVYILACLLEEHSLSLPYIKSAHVASEMMLDHWQQKAEHVLGVPVKAHYGQTERVSFMFQPLVSNGYYDNLEYGFTEFVKNDQEDHDIIGTGFLNRVMPLIRYKTGDTAELNEGDQNLSGLPLSVKKINGRSDDILIAASGNQLPGVNFYTMMYKIDGVKMFQLIQKELGKINVRLAVQKGYDSRVVMNKILKNLKNRLGELEISFELVDTIERDARTQKIRCIQSFLKS